MRSFQEDCLSSDPSRLPIKSAPFLNSPVKENLSGLWSRRIDDVNRMVYAIDKDQLAIIACRYH